MVERIAQIVGTRADHLVLDLGCGLGGPARRLAEIVGCRVLGVDLVVPVLAEARRRSPNGIRYVTASGERLPFRSAAFDEVWSLGVVAHVPDLALFAEEATRVLRPGGALAVTEAFWDGRRHPRFAAAAPQPWRAVPAEELVSALDAVGMDEISLMEWPGREFASDDDVEDPSLRADLLDGRLRSGMVLARKPAA
jgi:SAM-dependent methyltransferase